MLRTKEEPEPTEKGASGQTPAGQVRVRMHERAGPYEKGQEYDMSVSLAHHYVEVVKIAEYTRAPKAVMDRALKGARRRPAK